MRPQPTRRFRTPGGWLAAWALTLGLAACGGGSSSGSEASAQDSDSSTGSAGTSGNSQTVAQPGNTEGRLLASNCFQCHGTGGLGGFDSIRGSDAAEVLDYMNKPAGNSIMAAHAQGYTPEQLSKIIAYLKR